MKYLILLAVLATFVFANGADINLYRVQLLDKGYRVLAPDDRGISTIKYYGSINPTIEGDVWKSVGDHWDIAAWFDHVASDGTKVYQNTTASLNPGDTLRFQVEETRSDYIEISQARNYVVPADAPRFHV